MRNMLSWLGYKRDEPSVMGCDNAAAVRNGELGADRNKSKHMDIKYCFIRDVSRWSLSGNSSQGRWWLTLSRNR
jgi:hypothetical protein